ncbi:hypothetical protein [Sphingorhabdus profundilacus]|uniref:hypothetical protein n=1 Tax=Sphingorhabdus profundilacus TaxID=2509718 RepID=UPI001FE862D6|nr:hypothetical protein [Sphingorhabdus profundilacus]
MSLSPMEITPDSRRSSPSTLVTGTDEVRLGEEMREPVTKIGAPSPSSSSTAASSAGAV